MRKATFPPHDKPALFLLLFFVFFLVGCLQKSQVVYPTHTPVQTPEPTSIRVVYHTTEPTITLTVVPSITPTVDNDLPYYYGSLTVTLDDVGKTITLLKGESFSLYLGSTYQWDITVDPRQITSRNWKITPMPGEQGIYVAREHGEAVLKAVGSPACLQSDPPCNRPNVLFQVKIIVQ